MECVVVVARISISASSFILCMSIIGTYYTELVTGLPVAEYSARHCRVMLFYIYLYRMHCHIYVVLLHECSQHHTTSCCYRPFQLACVSYTYIVVWYDLYRTHCHICAVYSIMHIIYTWYMHACHMYKLYNAHNIYIYTCMSIIIGTAWRWSLHYSIIY